MNGVLTASNAETRLTVTHVGAKNDFQLIYKAESVNGNHHHHVTRSNSEKWVTENLISNMPEKSAVIFYNGPYNLVQVNESPSKHTEKPHMIQLLTQCVTCDATMTKHSNHVALRTPPPTAISVTMNLPGLHQDFLLDPTMCTQNTHSTMYGN